MSLRILIIAALGVLLGPAAFGRRPELPTVASVDLDRYLGRWYEIASLPAWFQRECTAVTATYSRREDGLIAVVNQCRKGSLGGRLKRATGRARVVDATTNAKLEVSFFGPFWGDYWILDLDSDYRWAVVGVPSRKYAWILSRTPTMEEALVSRLLERLSTLAFDVERFERTPQPGSVEPED